MRNSNFWRSVLPAVLFAAVLGVLSGLAPWLVVQSSNIVQPATSLGFNLNNVTQQNRLTQIMANGTPTIQSVGDAIAGGGGSFSDGGIDGNRGPSLLCSTGSVIGNDSGLFGEPNMYRVAYSPRYRIKTYVPTITSGRWFWGLANTASASNMVGADDPAFIYAGMQFSTPRGDTNIQVISENASQQISNSGIAMVEDIEYIFDIIFQTDTSVAFYINGSIVATHSTQVPVSTTNLNIVVGVETQVGASREVGVGWITVLTDR